MTVRYAVFFSLLCVYIKEMLYICKTSIAHTMKRIKFYKYEPLSFGVDLIKPILPNMDVFDGIGSLFNLTGNYYPTTPKLDMLCDASKHISTASTAWTNIAKDLEKSILNFSSINCLPKPTSLVKFENNK